MKNHLLSLGVVLLALSSAQAQDFSRNTLPSTKETPAYVLGPVQERWRDGQIDWYYNPANQPENLVTADVIQAIKAAASRWSGMCNISFNYMGVTDIAPNVRNTAANVDRVNVVGWGQLTNEMSSYSAYTQAWHEVSRFMADADVVINTAYTWTLQDVESVLTHELGHALGLNHSNVQASIMFASPYNSYDYLRTLRGDDAEACAALYTASANAESNRALNWAEQTFTQLLAPRPAVSGTFDGYYYRYYSATDSYVGVKNGRAYLMSADKVIRDQGLLSDFSNRVRSAGF